MRQGWKSYARGIAFALCALLALSLVAPGAGEAEAAGRSSAVSGEAKAKAKEARRQFTGVVTALDKTTITVEKRGKKPQSRVFSRHAETRTEGDLARDARVTVHYREEGGQAIAERVVVRPANGGRKDGR